MHTDYEEKNQHPLPKRLRRVSHALSSTLNGLHGRGVIEAEEHFGLTILINEALAALHTFPDERAVKEFIALGLVHYYEDGRQKKVARRA